MDWEIKCPCGQLFEIEEEEQLIECPDCGRLLDNEGNVLQD